MGKFTMRVKKVGQKDSQAWDELTEREEVRSLAGAKKVASSIVKSFNIDVPKKERRVLVSVLFDESTKDSTHSWEKQNLVTISDDLGFYDELKCTVCGITAKRFGVQWPPTRDKRYSDSVFANCDTAKEALDPVKKLEWKKQRKKERRLARKLKKKMEAERGGMNRDAS